VYAHNRPQPKFKFNGGRGSVELTQAGSTTVYLKKWDEYISVEKPILIVKNVIFGDLLSDMQGETLATNHKTNEYCKVQFLPRKSEKISSRITGQVYDRQGTQVSELLGSWLDEILLTNLKTEE